jgi:hypothetical protein
MKAIMAKGNRIYMLIDNREVHWLVKAGSMQHAREIAEVKKMKVKALFYEHPSSFGLDDERNPI